MRVNRGHGARVAGAMRAWRVIGVAVLLMSCPAARQPGVQRPDGGEVVEADEEGVTGEARPQGFVLTLSEGGPAAPAVEKVKVAAASPLGEREVAALLARLPALPGKVGAEADVLRTASVAAPRAGATVLASFPAVEVANVAPAAKVVASKVAAAVKPATTAALTPVRVLEHGDGHWARHEFGITFSQPMARPGALAADAVPVTMQPAVKGRWQWREPAELVFTPKRPLPASTRYTVTIKPGLKSAAGAGLAAGTGEIQFATPTPEIEWAYPHFDRAPTRPDIVLVFDQQVDKQAVLPFVHVVPLKGVEVPVELVAREDAVVDASVSERIDDDWARTMIVRPRRALPEGTTIKVTLAAGVPSLEGPLRSSRNEWFEFTTIGPLALADVRCESRRSECDPGESMHIGFNNPLDGEAFKPGWVTVRPEIPGMTVTVEDDELVIAGRTRSKTDYTVRVDAAVRDFGGDTLGAAAERKFRVGVADPWFSARNEEMTVLDPAAGGKLAVQSRGYTSLDVEVYAVTPDDWSAYLGGRDIYRGGRRKPKLPGKRVFAGPVAVTGDPDVDSETRLDLSPAIKDGIGQAIVVVSPPRKTKDEDEYIARTTTWVQATRIGLDAFSDGEKLVAFASGLADGEPLAGVRFELRRAGVKATSGRDGLATLKLGKQASAVLQARLGDDVAFVPRHDESYFSEEMFGWRAHGSEELRWHAFTDRGIYRPGETVRVKGWLRRASIGAGGLALPGVREIRYTLEDPDEKRLLGGTGKLSALGGFDLTLATPNTPGLGWARLVLEVTQGKFAGKQHTLDINLGEFRRPEYEVKVAAAGGPHFLGEHVDVTASAKYYGGGPLVGSEVKWTVTATPGSFTPPGRDEYWFGGMRSRVSHKATYVGAADHDGEHHLRVEFTGDVTGPMVIRPEAVVTDVNRQGWAMDTSVLVHPASVYVGLRSDQAYGRRGVAHGIEAIAVDLDGEVVAGREIVIRAVPTGWWNEEGREVEVCRKTSGAAAVRCSFTPEEGGEYRISATVTDAQGRVNHSEDEVWISGNEPAPQAVEQQVVRLVPDRRTYVAGETAKILVVSPFAPAEGVLTVRQGGLVAVQRVSLTERSQTIEVPVRDAFAPAAEVQLDVVGTAPRFKRDGTPDPVLPPRPAYGSGATTLQVPPRGRTLDVTVKPGERELRPGGKTTLEVEVRDAKGKAVVGGEVAVVVVDEAVLALTDHRIEDPLAVFYPRLVSRVQDYHGRDAVELADVAAVKEAEEAKGERFLYKKMIGEKRRADDEAPSRAGAKIRLRSDFDALALFAAELPTDANGRARVEVTLPDSLTRYRVTAVAVSGADRFGIGETAITARLPLLVRPSAPRFLYEGDRFELPLVVQNNTGAALTVDLAARADTLELTQGAGRRVAVPANDRVEVRLPATAVRAGAARFQVAAASGPLTDAALGELPVHAPPATEVAVLRGELASGAVVVPVALPGDVSARTGGLEVSLAATALAELSDAALYLLRYPHECNEQVASRMLSMMTLREVLGAFAMPGVPTEKELAEFLRADIDRLRGMQDADGAWGFWKQGEEPAPFLTVHVAHALARAQAKGHAVPGVVLEKAGWALEDIRKLLRNEVGEASRRVIVAYALYVRQKLGDRDVKAARALYAEAPIARHSLETLAWLLPVLGDSDESRAILRHFRERARESDGTVHFSDDAGDDGYWLLFAELRADAVILDALLTADPGSDLIPKLVRGLLAGRRRGRWSSTQDNVFALLALERYFEVHERAAPEFVARAWYGGKSAGEFGFKARTAGEQRTVVAMPELLRAGGQELVLAKDGPGRLYWRVALQHAPNGLAEPQDRGFRVARTYAAVDDPGDVRRDADGTWRIRAGARVRVRLSLGTSVWRYHVALVDPLPAGLEAVDPALATSAADDDTTASQVGRRWWSRGWYDHDNLRDDRVEVFAADLEGGVHEYAYTARATTPGTFAAPPTRAEEMYAPAIAGRGAGERVLIE